jgi:hypothetical protein
MIFSMMHRRCISMLNTRGVTPATPGEADSHKAVVPTSTEDTIISTSLPPGKDSRDTSTPASMTEAHQR